MDYLDFELKIGPGSGREYPVVVIRSPAGEARETMHFPFGDLELDNRLKDLHIALLRSGGKRRRALSPEQQAVQDFGRALFDALLSGEVRSRYDVSQREAAQRGKGLRLKLRIQPPELAALPWEFLHDAREAEYACLSHTPVVRYLELPRPPRPLAVAPPLRVLGMVASPRDQVPLDVTLEKQRVEEALKNLQAGGLVDVHWLAGQTWRDLQRAMRRGPWHVFHFIGHGGFDRARDEGFIVLADEDGETRRLTATQLGRLLANHRPLRLALLNSCEGARGSKRDVFSSTASILVQRGIPAVLAMQDEISDRAAIELARTLYEALADGMPVDAALVEARTAISVALINTVEWGVPVLYMRAPDGLLFEMGGTPVPIVPVDDTAPATGRQHLIQLHQILSTHLDGEELRTLCFYLAVDYDALRGEGKAGKARELVAHLAQRGQIARLVASGARLRPDIAWPAMPEPGVALQATRASTQPEIRIKPAKEEESPAPFSTRQPFEPEMILIPAGEFLMGSDPQKDKHARDNEQPQHTLYLPDYYLAKTPVTNAQYVAFVRATNHRQPEHWKGGTPPGGKEHHPVVYVSWHDAVAYCRWLSEATGRPYALPSEAQWEKGARGSDGRVYPWGDRWNAEYCNSQEGGKGDTTPVGAYPQGASPYGLLDMAGNVLEWTMSLWRKGDEPEFKYPYDPDDGRENLEAGSDVGRVLRGGAFHYSEWDCRCAYRGNVDPDFRYVGCGFRVVAAPFSPSAL